MLRARDQVNQANQSLGRPDDTPANLVPAEEVVELGDRVVDPASTMAACLEPLLERSKAFLEVIDQLGDRLAEVCFKHSTELYSHAIYRCTLTPKSHG
jgi:hypothetical protein